MYLSKDRIEEIDSRISGILLNTGISFPEDSIGGLLDKLGIFYSISAELPANVSGVIFFRDKKPFLATNSLDSLRRRIFSLAHEFGHYILHPLKEGEKFRLDHYDYSNDENKEETEANYFAGSLLVPESKLTWALEQTKNTKVISDYFGVSEIVILNRLKWIRYVKSI